VYRDSHNDLQMERVRNMCRWYY